jgi:ankyrin repeat protein
VSTPRPRSSLFSYFFFRKTPANVAPGVGRLRKAFATANIETIRCWLDAGNSANAVVRLPDKPSSNIYMQLLPLTWASLGWAIDSSSLNTCIINVVQLLLDYGADVNISVYSRSAFHWAVQIDGNGSGELIKYFIDNGADVQAIGRSKSFDAYDLNLVVDESSGAPTPEDSAFHASRRSTALAFTPRRRPDGTMVLDSQAPSMEARLPSILHEACDQGLATAVLLLIEAGADVQLKDGQGDTSLHLLARCNKPKSLGFDAWDTLIKRFVKAGADINAMNNYKATPLTYAVAPHHTRSLDMVKALVINGASVKHKGQNGQTIFHMLVNNHATYGATDDKKTLIGIFQYLLNIGLDPLDKDNAGIVPDLDGL